MMMNKNNNAYPVYYDASIKDDNIVISGIYDFECGESLFLINIEKTATGKVSEITDDRYPGFYIGSQLASQLVIDLDPDGDVIHAMKLITPDVSSDEWMKRIPPEITSNEWKNMYKYLSSID